MTIMQFLLSLEAKSSLILQYKRPVIHWVE